MDHLVVYRLYLPSKRLIHIFQLWVGWVQHFINDLSSRRQSVSHGAFHHRCVGFGHNVSLTSAINGCGVYRVRIDLQQMLGILKVAFWAACFLE